MVKAVSGAGLCKHPVRRMHTVRKYKVSPPPLSSYSSLPLTCGLPMPQGRRLKASRCATCTSGGSGARSGSAAPSARKSLPTASRSATTSAPIPGRNLTIANIVAGCLHRNTRWVSGIVSVVNRDSFARSAQSLHQVLVLYYYLQILYSVVDPE